MSNQNIEIKARIPISMEQTRETAQRLAGPDYKPEILHQTDTFFNAPLCRLKLRQENGNGNDNCRKAALISYARPDNVTGPKISNYIRVAVPDPDTLQSVLQMAMGIKGKVVKIRELYLVEWNGLTSRIHLDTVQGLGEFVEFEVMIPDLTHVANGEAMVQYLTKEFGLIKLLDGAYMDRIASQS